MIARAGSGHIGTSFSSLDIVTWLHLHELRGLEGQSLPTRPLLLLQGTRRPRPLRRADRRSGGCRFESLHTLRRLDGLPGHPDVGTPGHRQPTPARSAWASPRPRAWCWRNRLPGTTGRVFVLTGDGELQEGQFWESLAIRRATRHGRDHGHRGPQQDPVRHAGRAVSDLGDLEAKFAAFGWDVGALRRPRSRARSRGAVAASRSVARPAQDRSSPTR